MKNKNLLLVLTTTIILTSVAFLGCKQGNNSEATKSVSSQPQKTSDNGSIITTTPQDNKGLSTLTETPVTFTYIMTVLPVGTQIKFNTPWETSPLGTNSATIEGKGSTAEDEGYSHLIIKDVKSGNLTKLTLTDEEKNKLTAKDLEWIDETNIFIILGQPMGTVSKGGQIYKVNITSGVISLYASTTSSKEEFTAVHKTTGGYTFEKYVYEDDNFIKGHTEYGDLK